METVRMKVTNTKGGNARNRVENEPHAAALPYGTFLSHVTKDLFAF